MAARDSNAKTQREERYTRLIFAVENTFSGVRLPPVTRAPNDEYLKAFAGRSRPPLRPRPPRGVPSAPLNASLNGRGSRARPEAGR
ncbi:hypothetical protein EVAR_60204_1 [Eumeta japonica]|uniref:Uncharacterized protein n=1 Tax=Eumeta variegata TaxID=151549 RepID=A0A4C1Z975_EUMVA|nr:hypothetical protein EVAR_60204_1 [Eumeta japonica]